MSTVADEEAVDASLTDAPTLPESSTLIMEDALSAPSAPVPSDTGNGLAKVPLMEDVGDQLVPSQDDTQAPALPAADSELDLPFDDDAESSAASDEFNDEVEQLPLLSITAPAHSASSAPNTTVNGGAQKLTAHAHLMDSLLAEQWHKRRLSTVTEVTEADGDTTDNSDHEASGSERKGTRFYLAHSLFLSADLLAF